MSETRDNTLRALIQLIPPARALKVELEKSIHLELYHGAGDLAVKSFEGLRASVAKITDDPYVESLSISVSENATDKEKVSLALLAASQLAAYLEGQTGLGGMGGGSHIVIQTAPQIAGVAGVRSEVIEKVLDASVKPKKGEEEKEERPS
jgi:hypothetical protein